GTLYKFHVVSRYHGHAADKIDPFAFFFEVPPRTASIVWDLGYQWHDDDWLAQRRGRNGLTAPLSIYEVHLRSWMRVPEQGDRWLGPRDIPPRVAAYARHMGFPPVEFLPLTEHPFYGSWGYQTIGFFAPTSRYGTPQDLMFLIDYLHQRGIGVILD